MKSWLLLVVAFLLWPGCSSQNVCEEPDDIDFGEIVTTEKAKYLENDRVQYRCYLGYVLEGPEWIQCQGQEWTPRLPKCLAPCHITRQQLATKKLFVFRGQRKTKIIQSNHNLQFQCDEGHVLVPPSVRKCVDGHIELPLCISERGKNCSASPRIENGDIISLSEKWYRSGSSVEFRCQLYYAMVGQNRSFCDNGTWTKVPVCLDPCMIPRAELESQKIDVKDGMNPNESENIFVQRGHSIELTCRIGYALEADSSQSVSKIHCDGTPPVIPKCKEITCKPPRISNGSFRAQRTIYRDGDLIRIHCDSGFILEPDNEEKVVECTINGWSPSPKCVQIQCPTPEVRNGHIEPRQSQYVYNNEIEITCHKQVIFAVIQRKYISKCTANGWDPSPDCHEIQCFLPEVRNGRIQPSQSLYRYNDEIEITCYRMPFFIRDQKMVSKCTANGWDPPPSC